MPDGAGMAPANFGMPDGMAPKFGISGLGRGVWWCYNLRAVDLVRVLVGCRGARLFKCGYGSF